MRHRYTHNLDFFTPSNNKKITYLWSYGWYTTDDQSHWVTFGWDQGTVRKDGTFTSINLPSNWSFL